MGADLGDLGLNCKGGLRQFCWDAWFSGCGLDMLFSCNDN
jgi:hypothetical protein